MTTPNEKGEIFLDGEYNTKNLVIICNPTNRFYGQIARMYNRKQDLFIFDFDTNRFDLRSIGSVVSSMDDLAKLNFISLSMLNGFIAVNDSVFGECELIKMSEDKELEAFMSNCGLKNHMYFSYEYLNSEDRRGHSSDLADITFVKVRDTKGRITEFFNKYNDKLFFYKETETIV